MVIFWVIIVTNKNTLMLIPISSFMFGQLPYGLIWLFKCIPCWFPYPHACYHIRSHARCDACCHVHTISMSCSLACTVLAITPVHCWIPCWLPCLLSCSLACLMPCSITSRYYAHDHAGCHALCHANIFCCSSLACSRTYSLYHLLYLFAVCTVTYPSHSI